MSFSAHKHHHLEAMACEYEEKNLRAPVIVILGHHPAFYLSSCAMTAMGNNDYLTASAFLEGAACGSRRRPLGAINLWCRRTPK